MTDKYRERSTDKKLRKWFVNDMSRALLRRIDLRKGNLRGLAPFTMQIDYPITAIAGRNGAGKSTMLAMACCAYHNNRPGFKLKGRRNSYYTFSDFFVQHTEEVSPQGIEIFYQFAHDNWKKSETVPDGKGLAYQKRWKRKGSSRITGKSGFDLQEKVVAVPVAIGHALDDLDAVVHALQHAGVEAIGGTGDDALGIGLQKPSEADQRRQATRLSHVEPSCPTPPGGPLGAGVPELLELVLHQIHHHQRLIQIQ